MKKTLIWLVFSGIVVANSSMAQTWLHIDDVLDYVDIGDLDVIGNSLTVEARIYQQQASYGDIVSKHSGTTDATYLLRPYRAEITTTNGFAATPINCGSLFQYAEINTCLHVAMVYDGNTLSHYINGNLNGQATISGNIVQNNFTAKIGMIADLAGNQALEQFYGYIDEVRIWNIARTQTDIQTYMFDTIPSPATQLGLLGYYRFNSLANLAGNPTFNGALVGTGSISVQDTFCSALGGTCFTVLDAGRDEEEHFSMPVEKIKEVSVSVDGQRVLVHLTSREPSYITVRLISLDGKEVEHKQLFLAEGGREDLNFRLSTPGIYGLQVSKNGILYLKQVLIR